MDHRAAIRRDATALFELCQQDPGREIPACPGWSAADLRRHIIETFAGEIPAFGPATDDRCIERALAALAIDGAGATAVAHECAIHGWDIADAWDLPVAIDPDLACDGIEDFFVSAWPYWLDFHEKRAGGGQRLGLHAVDSGIRWLITLDERPHIERGSGPCDVEVAGSASDLFLWLWGRLDPPQVSGDHAVLEMIKNPQGRHLSPGF